MKKIVSTVVTSMILFTPVAYADFDEIYEQNSTPCATVSQNDEQILAREHLFPEKDAQNSTVLITNLRNIICKGNALKITFTDKFRSEETQAGARICFDVPEAIYTQEGTLIIPACSKVVATVIKIDKQHFPNKNARVYLKFECLVLADGTSIPMNAQPLTKDNALKEGPWNTTGKLVASTLGLGIVGAGAGTGFAFIPNPAKLGVGFAVGIPVGCTVGLITGLLTPGLKYHAKKGEAVRIVFCEDMSIYKQQPCPCMPENNCIEQEQTTCPCEECGE